MSSRIGMLALACALAVGCASQKHLDSADQNGEALRLDLAAVFVKKGSYMAAVPILRRVLSEQPKNLQARVLYGQVLREQGLYAQALQQYRIAVKLESRCAAAHAGMGILFDLMKEPEQAREAHERAIALEKGNADYWNNLGFSLYISGDTEGAIAALEKALALDPSMTVAYNNLGFAYGRRKDYEAALRSFRSAVGEAHALLNMALVYEGQEDGTRAEQCRQKAHALEPELKPHDEEK